MNPFASRIQSNSWVIPVSVLSLVLGFMLAAAWVTKDNRASRLALLGASQQNRVAAGPIDVQEEYTQLANEVTKLRADKTRLENKLSDRSDSSKVLNDSLQEVKSYAGLTELEGPGLIVTLRDSTKQNTGFALDQIIHYWDVLRMVNELWAAGAEAIAVNGHRVAPGTSFQCVGNTILVDTIKIAPPINIRAIGDSKTMMGGLNIPGGFLEEIRSEDPAMVSLEAVKKLTLPAYTGSTDHKLGQVPKDTK